MNEIQEEVLVRHEGRAGRITLNRPRAINALTHAMVLSIAASLEEFEADPEVEVIVVDGAGERGLCAGGDIRAIYEDALGARSTSPAFWADEYRLNARIAELSTPYVAIMDGLVMGGGVGISAHGSERVVTDRTVLAMPEVGIGLVPDVGGSYLLARSPDRAGFHAGLTTARMDGADAIFAGFADRFVPAGALVALLDDLTRLPYPEALDRHTVSPPDSELQAVAAELKDCYAAPDVPAVLALLEARAAAGSSAAEGAAAAIRSHSPSAVSVTFEALHRAAGLPSLRAALDQEFRTSLRCLAAPDLPEGIRAQIIDKDRMPRWRPATLAEVDTALVAGYFASLGADELGLAPDSVRDHTADERQT